MKLKHFFQSIYFKRLSFFFGIVFLIVAAFFAVNPEPFLRFGYVGVFVFNILGAGTFLIIPLVKHFQLLPLALVSACGITINDSISWFIGASGTAVIPKGKKIKRVEKSIQKYGVYALFFWSLIPFPYDLIGFVAGYLGISYRRFVIPTFLGKFIRLILIGIGTLEAIRLF